jgi:transposase InsO family protein
MKSVASKDVINFVKEHVIHRFGIPHTIATDGGSVFISEEFKKFATDMGIKLIRSSPYCAQANGQAEASKQSLIKLIKRKIRGIVGIPYFLQWRNKNFSLSPSVWTGGCITVGNYGRLEAHRVPKGLNS